MYTVIGLEKPDLNRMECLSWLGGIPNAAGIHKHAAVSCGLQVMCKLLSNFTYTGRHIQAKMKVVRGIRLPALIVLAWRISSIGSVQCDAPIHSLISNVTGRGMLA